MNKIITNFVYPFLVTGFLFIFLNSCKKDDDKDTLNGKTSAVFNSEKTYGTVKDVDGNIYKTITIGSQTWMAENLRTTHYRNGDPITNIKERIQWNNSTSGAYCNYNNTKSLDTIATFGRLYNWYTISDNRNIAPAGWHVPSDSEWTTLLTYLGGNSEADLKLKEKGGKHWFYMNLGSNSSGFTALPSGLYDDGEFDAIGYFCIWWSSTEYNVDNSYVISLWLSWDVSTNGGQPYSKNSGYSIRCIKD